jgi:hypothetical protein
MEVEILVDWGSVHKIRADSGTLFPENAQFFCSKKLILDFRFKRFIWK